MEDLINRVIEEIESDISHGDDTALAELLKLIPLDNLIQYLPEEEWKNFN